MAAGAENGSLGSGGWEETDALSGPFYKGDTDLIELTEYEARAFEPRAFED